MTEQINDGRRKLVVVTAAAGACAGAVAAVPFAASMLPSERAKALGAPVEVDVSRMAPGEMQVLEWRGKPVWVIRRTPEMLEGIKKSDGSVADPKSEAKQQPEYAANEFRSIKEEFGVLVGVCTHLGCSPQFKSGEAKAEMGADWAGGFYCPCQDRKSTRLNSSHT